MIGRLQRGNLLRRIYGHGTDVCEKGVFLIEEEEEDERSCLFCCCNHRFIAFHATHGGRKKEEGGGGDRKGSSKRKKKDADGEREREREFFTRHHFAYTYQCRTSYCVEKKPSRCDVGFVIGG